MISVKAMTPGDVQSIAGIARQADIDEMRDGAGVSIVEALEFGLATSLRASVIMAGDKPLAAFGDASGGLFTGVGVPWLISTKHVNQHARGFLRICRPLVQDMLARHSLLMNYVDDRNKVAIRWLTWLGFDMHEPIPAGVRGLPFRKFTMTMR